jgi:hypothetical protein
MRLESEEDASFFLPHFEWTHPLSRTYPSARSAELALSARSSLRWSSGVVVQR